MNPINFLKPATRIATALLLGYALHLNFYAAPPLINGLNPKHTLEKQWLKGVDLAVFLDGVRESNKTLLQAHRAGPRPGYAENALSTIEASLSDGAVFIELDVAKLGDGTLVLMHDLTADRTTTGHGELLSFTIDAFKSLRLVDNEGTALDEAPPTLNEALELLKGRGIAQLDMKAISVDEIAAAVLVADAVDRSLVITYSIADALRLHELLPEIMISVAVNSLDDIDILRENDFDLTRLQAWIGVGNGQPDLDAALADSGIETSFGNFPAEAAGTADYVFMSAAGAEILSVDDVPAAAKALAAREVLEAVFSRYQNRSKTSTGRPNPSRSDVESESTAHVQGIEIVTLSEQPWYEAEDRAVAREIASPRNSKLKTMSIADIKIPAGVEVVPHHHVMEEVYYIVAGEGTMMVEDEVAIVKAGQSVIIAPHQWHNIRNHTDEELRLIVTCVPAWAPELLEFDRATIPDGE